MNTIEIQAFFTSTGAVIERAPAEHEKCNCGVDHGSIPHYNPNIDKIFVDERTFESEARYWATVAHELTHWTGHEDRLDRIEPVFGREDPHYAFEEIVAQLGAMLLCEEVLDITDAEVRTWHGEYIMGYLSVFPQNLWEEVIDEAADEAKLAVVYILNQVAQRR